MASVEPPKVAIVSPSPKLVFAVPLNQATTQDLIVQNITDTYIAFKIKTTNPDRYLVKPTQDTVPPRTTSVVKIVLSALAAYPEDSDKFLVQTVALDNPITDLNNLAAMWKMLEAAKPTPYFSDKIKAKVTSPESEKKRTATQTQSASSKGEVIQTAALNPSIANVEPVPVPSASSSSSPAAAGSSSSVPAAAAAAAAPLPPTTTTTTTTAAAAAAAAAASPPPPVEPVPISTASASASTPAAAAAAGQTQAGQSQAVNAVENYQDLLAHAIQTTSQLQQLRDQLKSAEDESASLRRDKLSLERQVAELNDALLSLQQQQQQQQTGGAQGKGATEVRQRKPLDIPSQPASVPRKALQEVSSSEEGRASALSLHIWQVAIIALVCFFVGRMLT